MNIKIGLPYLKGTLGPIGSGKKRGDDQYAALLYIIALIFLTLATAILVIAVKWQG